MLVQRANKVSSGNHDGLGADINEDDGSNNGDMMNCRKKSAWINSYIKHKHKFTH